MGRILLGADRFDELINIIRNKRCGLLTAASGVDSFGIPTYYKLHNLGVLSVLFSPEHGVHSVMQDGGWSGEYVDKETGLPVFDLPSKGNPNIVRALSLCDIVIYDIQDVGARFYTYVYCMTYLMEECAKRAIPVYVLDRPDPISGSLDKISGAILDEERFSSFVGKYAMPVRYSLTCGEFALYINKTKNINCDLHIVKCENWSRDQYWDDTDLLWINPSPNIPTVHSAVNYIGTCLIEATNASEGRGTTRPFDTVGAPFVDSLKLTEHLNSLKLDGIIFSRAFFTPMFGKWQGECCEGVQLNITDKRGYDPHLAGLYILAALRNYKELTIRDNGLCLRYGNDALIDPCGFDPIEVFKSESSGIEKFKNEINNYLLYD